MALKQDFAKQLEAQISVWQGQIKDHQEQLKEAGAKAQADAEKVVKQLQQQAEEAKKLLTRVGDASEAAWKDMHAANLKAFEQLQKGWGDALKRFS
jgi:Importin repeat 6